MTIKFYSIFTGTVAFCSLSISCLVQRNGLDLSTANSAFGFAHSQKEQLFGYLLKSFSHVLICF